MSTQTKSKSAEDYLAPYVKGDLKRDYSEKDKATYTIFLKSALSAIKDCIKDAEHFKPKWVPCEDLPELKKGYSEMVWMYAHVGISIEPYVAYYCESGNVWRQKDNGLVIPRPYMYRLLELPQLPNENKEE